MIKDLEEAIGYHFQNISLLQNALAHSSYANERWHNSLLSNERLEFLGTAYWVCWWRSTCTAASRTGRKES